MNMLFMVFQNMLRDLTDALIVMIQVVDVDVMTFAILWIIQLFRVDTRT